MDQIVVEIRAAEGGDDAKLLVSEQLRIYTRAVDKAGLQAQLVEVLPGQVVLLVQGKGAGDLFAHEAGGHRWQRVPPTEKRGRVHTSTVTVAVLPVPRAGSMVIPESDLRWQFTRGSGAGGQHRNVTDSAVQLTHLPTGTMVRCESERSQTQNKVTALALLTARLREQDAQSGAAIRAAERRAQVGSGMRGDKRRTVQTQNDSVVDHVRGRRCRVAEYLRGDLGWLA